MRVLIVYEANSGNHHAAAFGTKMNKPARLPGSAARGIGRRLRELGYHLVAKPADFFVAGTTGPLSAGELHRAELWGAQPGRSETALAGRR